MQQFFYLNTGLQTKKAYDLRAQAPIKKFLITIKDQTVTILPKGRDQDTYNEWKKPVTEAETTEI